MPSAFARSIHDALLREDWADSIEGVKGTVRQELRALDRRARVIQTSYFNHSFAPDFVLTWPADSIRDRPVYLRFREPADDVIEDVGLLGDQRPILFAIGDQPDTGEPEAGRNAVAETAKVNDTLVTDADGLAEFIDRKSSGVVRLMTSAVAEAGRGVVDVSTAPLIATSIDESFAAVSELNIPATREALLLVDELLAPSQARRMSGFLQTLWVGAGGSEANFPGEANLSGSLTGDAIQFLLEFEDIEDESFWLRVARGMELDQLTTLDVPGHSKNLDLLVRWSGDRLRPRTCRIVEDEPRLNSDLPDYYWTIERHTLALRGPDFTAYVASRQDQLSVESPQRDGVSLATLKKRAGEAKVPVGQLGLSRGDRSVAYRSEASTHVLNDEALTVFAETFGAEASVRTAEALVHGGRLILNFITLTANGRTNTRFPLRAILPASLRLLLGRGDWAAIESLLPSGDDDTQLNLFAEHDDFEVGAEEERES